jgi:hypothetical protein
MLQFLGDLRQKLESYLKTMLLFSGQIAIHTYASKNRHSVITLNLGTSTSVKTLPGGQVK